MVSRQASSGRGGKAKLRRERAEQVRRHHDNTIIWQLASWKSRCAGSISRNGAFGYGEVTAGKVMSRGQSRGCKRTKHSRDERRGAIKNSQVHLQTATQLAKSVEGRLIRSRSRPRCKDERIKAAEEGLTCKMVYERLENKKISQAQ